jgi:hypothetical protein
MSAPGPRFRRRRLVALLFFSLALGSAAEAPALVITEIHYQPPGSGAESRRHEFIELYNDDPDPLDLTGYYFAAGVDFTFPERTFLAGRSYLVVCADLELFRRRYPIDNVIGNWNPATALDNDGERVSIAGPGGVIVATVRYGDRGLWPAGAAGTGHTLALKDTLRDIDDPENWTVSLEPGGTPGRANFPGGVPAPRLLLNEAFLPSGGPRWIELFNPGATPLDLTGCSLTDDPAALGKARLPDGLEVAPRGWLVLEEEELGLDFSVDGPGRDSVFIAVSDGAGILLDARRFRRTLSGASEALHPDGGRHLAPAADPTPGGPNQVTVERDIVINEIHYHPLDGDVSREFVELFNRGGRSIDLSGWRFESGITYAFPDGVTVAPGGFLVVARDPERIRSIYGLPADAVLGPELAAARERFGRLRDSGERITLVDARGNIADTVHYRDGGEWPFWPDGGGSTLELIDPWQDNDSPHAWDASDDSAKAKTVTFQYSAKHASGPGGESEIAVMLLDTGIALVDDLYIAGDATTELVAGEVFVEVEDEWRYFKGTREPSAPAGAWREAGFDDSEWLRGRGPFGYGEPDLGTVLDDMRFSYSSVYLRKTFEVAAPSEVDRLILEVDYDDGYVAYLNGAEVARGDISGNPPPFDGFASASREAGAPVTVEIRNPGRLLAAGTNVLAVQVHNNIINSPDLFLSARLFSGRIVDVPEGWNMVPNGSFEAELDPEWIIEGTHIRSGRTSDEPIAGAGSLKVVASRAGDQRVNRIERELARSLAVGREYEISLKARWVVGSASLLTLGYNFGLAKSHALEPPEDAGTPGRMNSVTRRQLERHGDHNLGPLIDRVSQSPPLPGGGQPGVIGARNHDSDGVAAAVLRYAIDSPLAPFQSLAMSGPDGEGFYSAEVPGQAAGTRVVYEIVAEDRRGRAGRYPLDHLERTHPLVLDPAAAGPLERRWAVYGHKEPAATPYHAYQVWLHRQNEEHLSSRRVHSNDPVEGSLVVGSEEIHQGSGLRFQGSALSRSGWGGSFRVRLPDDVRLHGRFRRFNLDADGANARDRITNYILRNTTGDVRVPYNTHAFAHLSVNARTIGSRIRIDPPGRQFLSRWFGDDDGGQLFEMDERYIFSDAGIAQTRKNAYWLHPPHASDGSGVDKENYRFYFNLRTHRGADDFARLIATARVLTPGVTPDARFDLEVWDHLHVEEFLRVLAVRQNTGDVDTWGVAFGRSAYFYRPEVDGRWWLFPWDSDKSYTVAARIDVLSMPASPRALFPNPFPEVQRLLNRPPIKRRWYAILKEMVDGRFSSEYLAPYMDLLHGAGASSDSVAVGRPGGWVDQRAALIRRWIEPAVYPEARLEITTNGGRPLAVEGRTVSLSGTAPAEVAYLRILLDERPHPSPPAAVFSREDFFGWSLEDIPIPAGRSEIIVYGADSAGTIVDWASISVVSSSGGASFIRGDAVPDGVVNLTDAIAILQFLYLGASAPSCPDAFDVDDNGRIEITDAIRLLNYLFLGGDPPPPPFETAGPDPTEDELDCSLP